MSGEFKNLKVKPKLSYEKFLDLVNDIEMLSVMKRIGDLIGLNVSPEIIDKEINNKVALILNSGWSLPEKTQEAIKNKSDENKLELDAYLPEVYKEKNRRFSACKVLREKFNNMSIEEKIADLLKFETWTYIEDSHGQIIGKGENYKDFGSYDEDDDPENQEIVHMLQLVKEIEEKALEEKAQKLMIE